jgi:hypothetical protein
MNRQPKLWRDKREVDHGGSIEHRLSHPIAATRARPFRVMVVNKMLEG